MKLEGLPGVTIWKYNTELPMIFKQVFIPENNIPNKRTGISFYSLFYSLSAKI